METIILCCIFAYKRYMTVPNKSAIVVEFTISKICTHLIAYFGNGKFELIQLFANSLTLSFYIIGEPTLMEFLLLILLYVTAGPSHAVYIFRFNKAMDTLFYLYCYQFYFRWCIFLIQTYTDYYPELIIFIPSLYLIFVNCRLMLRTGKFSQSSLIVIFNSIYSALLIIKIIFGYDIDILAYSSAGQLIISEIVSRYKIAITLIPFVKLMCRTALITCSDYYYIDNLISDSEKLTDKQWKKIVHDLLADKNRSRIKLNIA